MLLIQRILRAIRGEARAPVPPQPARAPETGEDLQDADGPAEPVEGEPPFEPFSVDVQTLRMLQGVAEREQRPPEAIASQILGGALRGQEVQEENWACWQRLTPREQEIAALICLYYTTRQIASRLHISPETVKTHAERVLNKFQALDRSTLRARLESWDFTAWDR